MLLRTIEASPQEKRPVTPEAQETHESELERGPQENEITLLHIDKEKVVEGLEELGAEKRFEGIVEDWYFDTQDGSLRSRGFTLRIRRTEKEMGDAYEFTIKKQVHTENGEAKRAEQNFSARSFYEAGARLAEYLNEHDIGVSAEELVESLHKTKSRTSYNCDGVNFDFDTLILDQEYDQELGGMKEPRDLTFIPTFLEVEVIYNGDDPEEEAYMKARRQELMDILGLKPCEHSDWSIPEIIDYYRTQKEKEGG